MFLGLGLGLPVTRSSKGFTPLDLGDALYDYWDAERPDTITQIAGVVSEWRSVKGGLAAVQATEAAKPIYSASSFNGRPGVTFDGDAQLTVTGVGTLPTGATACEIWVVASMPTAGTVAGIMVPFTYGGNAAGSYRRLYRNPVSNVNNMFMQMGTGGSAPLATNPTDSSGTYMARAIFDATMRLDIDGVAGTPVVTSAPATGTTRIRIGARNDDAPTNFYIGPVSLIAVTALLSAAQSAQMNALGFQRMG